MKHSFTNKKLVLARALPDLTTTYSWRPVTVTLGGQASAVYSKSKYYPGKNNMITMIPGTKLHVTVLTQLKQLPLRGIRILTSRSVSEGHRANINPKVLD